MPTFRFCCRQKLTAEAQIPIENAIPIGLSLYFVTYQFFSLFYFSCFSFFFSTDIFVAKYTTGLIARSTDFVLRAFDRYYLV